MQGYVDTQLWIGMNPTHGMCPCGAYVPGRSAEFLLPVLSCAPAFAATWGWFGEVQQPLRFHGREPRS